MPLSLILILLLIFFFVDITDIRYIVNYDYPHQTEDYVHRIGRTGRSNKTGTAYTFFNSDNPKTVNTRNPHLDAYFVKTRLIKRFFPF